MSDRYWHFLRDDRRLQFAPHQAVVVGETYTAEGPLELCENGMHASRRALDALVYAPGSTICRVRLDGELVSDRDKVCARSRTVLWLGDIAPLLHLFSCVITEQVLTHAADGSLLDPRALAAVTAKRAWLRGELDDTRLDAAREAIWHHFMPDDAAMPWEVPRIGSLLAMAAAASSSESIQVAVRTAAWVAAVYAARERSGEVARLAVRAAAWSAASGGILAGDARAARDAGRDNAWAAAWAEARMASGDIRQAASSAAWEDAWAGMSETLEGMLRPFAPAEGTPI